MLVSVTTVVLSIRIRQFTVVADFGLAVYAHEILAVSSYLIADNDAGNQVQTSTRLQTVKATGTPQSINKQYLLEYQAGAVKLS